MNINRKVAVCVSGHPRFIEKGYELFSKNVVETNKNHGFDFFCHSWVESDEEKDKVISIYKPKNYKLESQKEVWPLNTLEKHKSLFSMFYGIKSAFELKVAYEEKSLINYDIVIRTRYDAGIVSPIIIESDIGEIRFIDKIRDFFRPCDWFYFGASLDIRKVSSIYDNMIKDGWISEGGEDLYARKMKEASLGVVILYPDDHGKTLVLIRNYDSPFGSWRNVNTL